jgi:N-acetylmuramoyl-L-alanine amidase
MKKYCLKLLIIFVLLTLILSFPYAKASLPLFGKTITIDIGHGGKDPGTVVNNILEKDINLKIGKYLEKELIKKGANVILTRNGDYDLSSPNSYRRKKSDFDNRIKIINNSSASMYVSIHLNYLEQASYYGPQVFYNNINNNNKKIANNMQNILNKKLKTNRKVKLIPEDTYMYSRLNVTGVLVECGFLSNYNEKTKLMSKEYQQKIAKYISEGIVLSI